MAKDLLGKDYNDQIGRPAYLELVQIEMKQIAQMIVDGNKAEAAIRLRECTEELTELAGLLEQERE